MFSLQKFVIKQRNINEENLCVQNTHCMKVLFPRYMQTKILLDDSYSLLPGFLDSASRVHVTHKPVVPP
jgi:hypothetical protein